MFNSSVDLEINTLRQKESKTDLKAEEKNISSSQRAVFTVHTAKKLFTVFFCAEPTIIVQVHMSQITR